MLKSNEKKLFWLVLLSLIAIRLINITMPILEGTAMRQVQTAMIARNFYRDGFNILYPRVDFFGNSAGYLVLEFPLFNVLAALGYKTLGGVHEWVGRLLSILFFSGAASFLYGITKRLFSIKTAIWALFIFGILPLSVIFSRTFMPDFEMLFFSLGALYFFLIFYLKGKYMPYWLSAIFLSLALLIKPHSFYIFFPLAYLLWKKQNIKFAIDYKNWLYLIIALLPAFFWYLHGQAVHSKFTLEQAFNYEITNWFNPKEFFNMDLYKDLFQIYAGILLTPIGLTLFIAGLFIKTKDNGKLIWAWLAGSIVYLLAFITHINDPYYNLNMLPIVSIFIARAIVFIEETSSSDKIFKSRWAKAFLAIVILTIWLRYALYAYVVPQGYRYIPEAGARIKQITGKDDLVIASAASGPQALYFCDRKGWGLRIHKLDKKNVEKSINCLEDLRKKGAKFFISTVMSDFEKNTSFSEHMFKNYKLIERKPKKFIIFSLSK